jgi:uncharacterized protein involved in type VI secretion and phage assembly
VIERVAGVYIGTVDSNKVDQDGCISIKIPSVGTFAARVVTSMAGDQRGAVLLPEQGDQVLVMPVFGSDVQWAMLGSLWSRNDKPPETNSSGANDVKVIKTRGGSVIRFVDKDGDERIEIADKTGNNTITIATKTNTITITAGDAIKLSSKAVTIEATSGDLVLKGGPNVKIN